MPTPRQYSSPAKRQAAYRQRQADARVQEQAQRALPLLPRVATIPGQRRWEALMQQALGLLESVQEEMQEYYDQRSEAGQESERGESFLERLEEIQGTLRAVEDLA